MAKRKRTRSKSQEEYPGWMWMMFGLGVGLSVAFAIYMKDQRSAEPVTTTSQPPASMTAPIAEKPITPTPEPEKESEPRFSFYDMLPKIEVIIPEEEPEVTRDQAVDIVEEPGKYVLQAGSFTMLADADRRRAELALLGIESRVQRILLDGGTFHRVQIGPISDLDKLNRIRKQLSDARIDVLRIRK